MFHKLVRDEDCHWYIIPEERESEWEEFCKIPTDDERSWDVPEFALRVDGYHRIYFKEWEER